MTKTIEYQQFYEYIGMSPKAYVERGLAIKRMIDLLDKITPPPTPLS